ncbi:EamA family transporter [Epibacterium ulvae]|uniref:EamA family transporter n=1 Tax=Epibacterium ulvae TaxID=1156985 RepID=UPI0024930F24|nr:DMT family transporter [Epibacterium ulvae]
MWITYGLTAGVVLGLYDYWTKKGMDGNGVMAVVFWSSFFGAAAWLIAFLPVSYGSGFHVDPGATNLKQQLFILFKGLMMTGSWIFAYYSVRELPMSFSGAMRASGPLWTFLGGALIFGEILTPLQFCAVLASVIAYFLLSQIGKKEGISITCSTPILMMLVATLLSAMTTVYDKWLVQVLELKPNDIQAWSALHRCLLAGIIMWFFCRGGRSPMMPNWSFWIPLIGLAWVGAEWVYFLAIQDPNANVTYLSIFRRVSLIVGFLLSVLLIGESNVGRKSIVILILLISTITLILHA